jgi:hypothetical protein
LVYDFGLAMVRRDDRVRFVEAHPLHMIRMFQTCSAVS